LAALNK